MRPLELQFNLNAAECRECHDAFLDPSQLARQKFASRALRAVILWVFLITGGVLIYLLASSHEPNNFAQKLVVPYTTVLIMTLAGPYALSKLRDGRVTTHFAFMDSGWRYYALASKNRVRDWDDLVAWLETKRAFHLAYKGDEAEFSPLKRIWTFLNRPVAGAPTGALRQAAMIPKRILTRQQIGEIRSILKDRMAGTDASE